MKGDEDGFGNWYNSNKEKWDVFVEWFSDNGLEVNESNKFLPDNIKEHYCPLIIVKYSLKLLKYS